MSEEIRKKYPNFSSLWLFIVLGSLISLAGFTVFIIFLYQDDNEKASPAPVVSASATPSASPFKLPKLGVCVVYGDSDPYGVVGVYSPQIEDGVISCPDGTFVAVSPQKPEKGD